MPDPSQTPRELIAEYDVLIVGAGPAGLSCAIRLKQLAQEKGREVSVCIIEKGSEVGAHLVSGAVLEPRALEELFPDWRTMDVPNMVPVTEDRFMFLTEKGAWKSPLTPPQMNNHGNYIISLGVFGRWLDRQAEALGIDIYPGFAGAEALYDDGGRVVGIGLGDVGVGKDGQPTAHFQRGGELRAKQTVIAEGCRGSLAKKLFEKFGLRDGIDPQTYGIGIKEVWEIDPAKHKPGLVMHTVGWPMDMKTYGGSFLYHWDNTMVSLGFVIGLDYRNPFLSPYEEFQRFKHHPLIRNLLENGKRVGYAARALSEGGYQSIPKLTFPGGLLIGDAAGFLNVPKIKGNHMAMKSGMVAAEALFDHLGQGEPAPEVADYRARLEKSWLWQELHGVRNIRPYFHGGLIPGLVLSAIDTALQMMKIPVPWTLRNHADETQLKPARQCAKIEYPKPDGVISFDRLTSVSLTGTNHEEKQPAHLKLRDPALWEPVNYEVFASPESLYCPAGVYEAIKTPDGKARLQINAQNCIHCKTCDIKDPIGNIDWCTPEGGGGPNYSIM